MSAKMAAARKAAFLKALAATGNVTLSAEKAKVSRSWARLHRKQDPAFDAACRAAVAAAKARLGAHPERRPPRGWGHLDGVELVVRGTNGRRIQIARARLHQWTPRTEDRFLATLGATCNVKAAYIEAGMTKGSAYSHRKRWRTFAKLWDAALAEADTRLDAALVESGLNLFSARELPPAAPLPPMTVAEAIHVLHMHKHKLHGLGKAPGVRWRPPPTFEDVREGILRKIAAIKRARGVSAEEKARAEREYARRRPRRGAG